MKILSDDGTIQCTAKIEQKESIPAEKDTIIIDLITFIETLLDCLELEHEDSNGKISSEKSCRSAPIVDERDSPELLYHHNADDFERKKADDNNFFGESRSICGQCSVLVGDSAGGMKIGYWSGKGIGLPLTQNHRCLRRQWGDEKRMWAAEWNKVVFTDESRCLQHHDGRIRVWRHRGESMLNSCVMHRHTGSAPGIMV
ncbi:transposable element Tcb1 transposase [Trichonephila clavipes]|uniref:Transposable element Tcb1 transposase n=1 Tax=Trichonephila clavipes TaxID=2585209 RepID=A0A8X6SRN9_TRICX|nr:transposable element Tcb1 transposase [Trichonephila clavipes]